MNERIRELMKEANKDIPLGKPFWPALEEFSEKFAESIVRECMAIAQEYDGDKLSGPGMIIANRIDAHFGVNEE